MRLSGHKIKNGGGGENRTRVQGSCEAGIYKFSLRLFQLCLATPAEKGKDDHRVCAYVLVRAIMR